MNSAEVSPAALVTLEAEGLLVGAAVEGGAVGAAVAGAFVGAFVGVVPGTGAFVVAGAAVAGAFVVPGAAGEAVGNAVTDTGFIDALLGKLSL